MHGVVKIAARDAMLFEHCHIGRLRAGLADAFEILMVVIYESYK